MKTQIDKNIDVKTANLEDILDGLYDYHKKYNPMKADLKDRVAIITGSTGMIGGAAAELFALSGAKVILTGRKDDVGKEMEDKINANGGNAKYYHLDLTSEQAAKDFVKQIIADYGRIDILIANAGGNKSTRQPLPYFKPEDYDWNIDVNLNIGSILLSHEVIPYMIKQGGGSIAFTTSVCGVSGLKLQSGFVASKFAVSAITRSMSLEYGKYNIRVNALAPGSVPLPDGPLNFLWSTVNFDDYSKNFEDPSSMVFDIPARRPGYPADQAGILLYFASDDANYTTGQVVSVDGGWTAGLSGLY